MGLNKTQKSFATANYQSTSTYEELKIFTRVLKFRSVYNVQCIRGSLGQPANSGTWTT